MDEKQTSSESIILPVFILGMFFGAISFMTITANTSVGSTESTNSNKNTMDKVCVEKDVDFVEAYPEDSWQKLDQLPDKGVLKKEDFTSVDGGIWVTLNTSEANIEPPQRVKYKSVSECVEYRMVAN